MDVTQAHPLLVAALLPITLLAGCKAEPGGGGSSAKIYVKNVVDDGWGAGLSEKLKGVSGVASVTVDETKQEVVVSYDEKMTNEVAIQDAIRAGGLEVRGRERMQLYIPDVDSSQCVVLVRKALENVEGVTSIDTSVETKTTWVEYVDGIVRPAQLTRDLSSSLGSRVERVTFSERDYVLFKRAGR